MNHGAFHAGVSSHFSRSASSIVRKAKANGMFFPALAGFRQEQDIYVRLIDSVSKQVMQVVSFNSRRTQRSSVRPAEKLCKLASGRLPCVCTRRLQLLRRAHASLDKAKVRAHVHPRSLACARTQLMLIKKRVLRDRDAVDRVISLNMAAGTLRIQAERASESPTSCSLVFNAIGQAAILA